MKPDQILRASFSATVALMAMLPASAGACAACMGDVNSKVAPAANDAIFVMLGVIGFMLSCFGAFAFHLMRRASQPLPPHVELDETMAENDPSAFQA